MGVKAIPAHTTDCVKLSLCQIDSDDSFDSENDSFHQINPDYGKVQCITQNCQNCGTEKIQLKVLQANPNLQADESIIQWNRWVWVEKFPGSTTKKMILRTEQDTRKDLLDVFLDDLKSLSHHLFSANWNYAQFQYIRDNLKPGYLLSVLDFGQNYMNVFQDEPQSIHWDYTQMTIHPIVNFFIKQGESVVTVEKHIMISNDKNHDKYAVKTFEEASLNYLKEKGFTPTHIIQFNDNCASQYKGKGTFQFVSCSDILLLKMYFGARHGKSPADGAVGRVKSAATRAVKAWQVIIRSAQEFYTFCVDKLIKNTTGTFVQKFFYIDNIDRNQTIEAVTTKSSSIWFSVRSCGLPYVIESQEIGCVCPPNRINSFPDRNDRSSNRSNSFCNSVDNFVGCLDETSDRDPVMDVLKNFESYSHLETYVDLLPKNVLRHIKTSIHKYNRKCHTVDDVAVMSLPCDSPCNCVPIWTVGDGVCLTHAFSMACFGDDKRNVELRARIVIEGVYNKRRYLDNDYLALGSNSVRQKGTFTQQYALFSGQYAHGELLDVIESVYDNEMLAMCKPHEYMGMWQIWAATNLF